MTVMTSLHQLAQWLGGATLTGAGEAVFSRVHTDTRTIQSGDLFVALKGERFDANDFLLEAQSRGASAVLCHKDLPPSKLPQDLPRIEVPDTLKALAELATAWRARFSLPVIAVTGSNGKTTVTQMIASILTAQHPGEGTLATQGNLNNAVGVPLTVLRLRAHHAMAVVELGMNHPGEIAALAAIAQPTVALVNNAQREHLEFMQTVDAVAVENGSVIDALNSEGIAVYPADDTYAPLWQRMTGSRRSMAFSMERQVQGAGLHCSAAQWVQGAWQVQASGTGRVLNYRLAIAGRHNVKNSLAAAACALAAGVSPECIERGLSAFQPVKGRSRAMSLQVHGRTVTVVDDSYNANPDSVRAAIDVLAELPGPRLLVLGDMGEVGEQGPEFHREAGEYAHARGIDELFALGAASRFAVDAFPGGLHFDSIDALNAALQSRVADGGSVLVKGSRFMRMERAVAALMQTDTLTQETSHV